MYSHNMTLLPEDSCQPDSACPDALQFTKLLVVLPQSDELPYLG